MDENGKAQGTLSPFLTEFDKRAEVKGSRDPLGIQQIWTRMGRRVVGNLTTVSSSAREFTTVMLGYHFAERVAQELGPATELHTFLKWEQLAAYSRAHVNQEFEFRGTERVAKRLYEKQPLALSTAPELQILSNQKIYGLWGLFTVPARTSGLLEGDPPRVAGIGSELPQGLLAPRDFLQRTYIAALTSDGLRDGNAIVDLLRKEEPPLPMRGMTLRVMQAVAKILRRDLTAGERRFFGYYLRDGGPTDARDGTGGRQALLARLFQLRFPDLDEPLSPGMLRDLAKAARAKGEIGQALATELDRVRTCEAVMAPMSRLFDYMMTCPDRPIRDLIDDMRKETGPLKTIKADEFADLGTDLAGDATGQAERWGRLARAGTEGDYGAVIDLLLEQNKAVMDSRGGAAWAEKRDSRLVVKLRQESGRLPKKSELPTLWVFPYFLQALRLIAGQVAESAHG
jgi:hypothetical protein